MVVLLVLWIGFNVLGLVLNFCSCAVKPITKLLQCLFCCKGKKRTAVECKDIFKEFNALALESMLRKARDDLNDFTNNMDKGNSITYKQHRFDEEINFEATTIIDIYKRRIRQIELVVDSHLTHLHGKWNMDKFRDLNVDQKLRYILQKQHLVDKEMRMRMVDITQSFNLLDSQMFKTTKIVQEKVEDNEHYTLGAK